MATSGSMGKKADMEPMKNNLLAKQKQLEEAGLFVFHIREVEDKSNF